jgi:hypothetical protein
MSLIRSIPERYQSGFKELSTLTKDHFQTLLNALEQVSFNPSIEALSTKIEELIDVNGDVEEIFESVGSIVSFIEDKSEIKELTENIGKLGIDYKLFDESEKDEFVSRLSKLLDKKHILIASKADELVNNYSNSYVLSKVVTDFRPVFDIDASDKIEAGIILHNLTIHYQSNDEPFHRNITISLTAENIESLREALERAEKKDKNLTEILRQASIVNLTI